jgi:hypothetical protein
MDVRHRARGTESSPTETLRKAAGVFGLGADRSAIPPNAAFFLARGPTTLNRRHDPHMLGAALLKPLRLPLCAQKAVIPQSRPGGSSRPAAGIPRGLARQRFVALSCLSQKRLCVPPAARYGPLFATMRATAAAPYRVPAIETWPAVSSSAATSRSERLRPLTG